jgi:hypothetical protein
MSGKKARKNRPRKSPAPSSAAQRARSSQPKGKATTTKKNRSRKVLSPLEVQLRKTLAEMGLARARRVFAKVEASFDD